ncbi:MAG: hypothetical protein H0T44_05195 [Gemmatimonadales bacterium]|nr:hypothetical protein [Gemmatimonadales bacterium]MDQ3427651.1 hypothetical protein [Gemmatimonadota bacterium]
MSEVMPNAEEAPAQPVAPWDPFQLMDRMDEEALRKELEGVASTELVYVVKEGGQEIVGLSKTGVDECCMALVSQGQVIREEDLHHEILGEGEVREALFKVKAARFAVSPAGQEVRLDQVIGVKRQPLYFEPAQLDLDARVLHSKKYKGKTYRELLASADGREYLAWMADNFNEPEIRDFVRRLLAGEEIVTQRGRQLNPHWYEAGAMKAARNARFRLIPGNVRAQIIATARQSGNTRVIEAQPGALRSVAKAAPVLQPAETVSRVGPYAPTEKQVAFYQRLAESPVFTDDERRRAFDWLATKATRQTIKDQIDWLKRQVETRKAGRSEESAA